MNFQRSNPEGGLSFQLAPMIDVVFLLLIYFMSASIFGQLEREIDITVPRAETGEEAERQEGEVIINLDPNGAITVNRRALSRDDLAELLTRLGELFQGQSVILRADEQTPYHYIIDTLDLCRQAGIWNISFATLQPERE
ncbi:MAG: biopolymer transporter ExbD [Verrucomicrobiota bacterium]|jgi:biopolymer transport protein ExbD|nr:biopolymer transporter ExbD [Verrucomicrobiota bacterium]MDD8045316.1 biopolymer transporter ExbD [Verrucomicrobiota bacterium]MDD8050755.1 biopolymer transporter ExbD [Verrucomicrobiota bacterium]MDI9382666.1 biopolymer transporter ExbD [Verrucomicrobiota bacterium]HCF96429.1 biopolymer transporter ExbD [Verrucomicrobiota bacterium]